MKIEIKNLYKPRIYPVDDRAKLWLAAIHRGGSGKTFDKNDLERIEALGEVVEIIPNV